MCLFVTWTASPSGVPNVQIGSLIVRITVVIVDAVSERWIISALGVFAALNFAIYQLWRDTNKLGRVGGAVGENNFKFFIQFTGYTALYCTHILVVMAIYVARQKQAQVCDPLYPLCHVGICLS
jgi:hypothetical protein